MRDTPRPRQRECRRRWLAVLFGIVWPLAACFGAPPSSVPSAPTAKTDAQVRKSPQEVGDAFVAATRNKDWKSTFHCFAPASRDLVVVQLLTMTSFAATANKPTGDALERLLKSHGFDQKSAWAAANDLITKAKDEKTKPDLHNVVKVYVDSIKDKEACFGDLLKWAQEHFSSGRDGQPPKATLQEFETAGSAATAKLSTGSGDGWELRFSKVDEGWFIELPEAQFAPSGWNDGFLFDYLDALHSWRF